jgi:DNA-binding NarL/FixJ family response regulator
MIYRIAIVDDHALVRLGLSDVLSDHADLNVVAMGDSAADAVSIAVEHAPDLMMLDVNMPGGGIEAAGRIRAEMPAVKILMFSFLKDAEIVRQSLAAGATGYLVKGVSGADLELAVRTVLSGSRYIDPAVAATFVEFQVQGNSTVPT